MVKNIYLTGGAFGMIYQMGAMRVIKDYSKYTFYGCSAGALAAAMILIGYTSEEMLKIYDDISNRALDKMKREPYNYETYNLTNHHFEVLDMINKDYPDAYITLTRKELHIGVTLDSGFRWYKRFSSNAELFNILLCSFHVPFLCSYNASIGSSKCIDGGFGMIIDNHLPPHTLVISPKNATSMRFDTLNGEMPVKICATPPPMKERMYYYTQGFKDMRRYVKHRKSSQCRNVTDENSVPNSVWWFLRILQPNDTSNVLSKLL
jgi:hypothetical protein